MRTRLIPLRDTDLVSRYFTTSGKYAIARYRASCDAITRAGLADYMQP
jgi:hypothetical protein